MNQKKIPRYREIADNLTNAILAKEYPIGSQLPPEAELCDQLDASRHTIREALRILEQAGLISRRQGSGSLVIANTPPVRYRQTVDSIEDLMQYGSQSRLRLLSVRELQADAALSDLMHCRESDVCIELLGVRMEREEPFRPFALSQVLFPPQSARRRAKLLDIDTALGVMLTALDARTLGRIEQTFEAVALDAQAATQLGVKKGSPSLRAHRAYYDRGGKLILVAISWHRGDLFRISTVLKHEGG